MPKGQYDRTKTKAQRDAEKLLKSKNVESKKKPGPKPGKVKKAEKVVVSDVVSAYSKNESGDVGGCYDGECRSNALPAASRLHLLLEYGCFLVDLKNRLNIDTSVAIDKNLKRLEQIADELQPLAEVREVEDSIKAYAAKADAKAEPEAVEEAEETEEAEEEVVEVAKAPVAVPAPIQFNPVAPTNG